MRWLLIAICCISASAETISGIVVDAEGHPLKDVHLDRGAPGRTVTDSEGRFRSSTPIIFRKLGYESKFLPASAQGEMTIVMRKAITEAPPQCSKKCETLEGWDARFCFQKLPGVDISQSRDVDYGVKVLRIKTASGWHGIQHAAGPMWGSGFPLDSTVAGSAEYSEKLLDDGSPLGMVDAHGKLTDGTFWREIGHFGESAQYEGVDEQTARLLDRILDSVCLLPARH